MREEEREEEREEATSIETGGRGRRKGRGLQFLSL